MEGEKNKLEKKEIVVDMFSKDTLGLKSENVWYNVDKESKEKVRPLFSQLTKGSTLSLTMSGSNYVDFTITKKVEKGWAEDITNMEDLLKQAHDKGLKEIKTEMVSIDWDKERALFKATVTGFIDKSKKIDGIFTGYGDVTETNIGSEAVKKHWIRFAESRSIVRALRWYVGEHKVAKEELSNEEEKE